jgi:hypothetical protein
MRYIAVLCLSLIVMVGGSCQNSSGKVIVIDNAGNPITGAAVSAVSPSINAASVPTDNHGEARIPLNFSLQQIQWVNIQTPGYDPVQVALPAQWPLQVTMTPTGTAKPLGIQLTTKP